MTGTSSADPFVLSTYGTNGTAMAMTLSQKATALTDTVDALVAAGESIPGLADLVAAVTDLAADWYHLDEHAGDVAAGFLATLGPGYHHDGSPMVMTLDDGTLDELGQVGFADRNRAIAEAEELAAEYQAMLDALANGDPLVWDPPRSDAAGVPIETMERMAGLLEGYGVDSAFAIAFTEATGVEGMVGLRNLYRTYAQEAREVDRPRGGTWTADGIEDWVDEHSVGAALVLHTAMDTRRATTTHTEPDNAGVDDEARLDDAWVDRFENYGGDAQLDYSLLVVEADLPADVLVAVGDNHLGDQFGHDDRGSDGENTLEPRQATDADLNIAAAIAANPDASIGWLASDGIAPGTDTVELVLTSTVPDPAIYGVFADIVDTGLTHPTDDAGRGDLMERTIRIVGNPDGGGLHVPWSTGDEGENAATAMRQALGNGAAANMDLLHAMITDDWPISATSQDPPDDAGRTHDFLRETMADAQAADAVAAGYSTFAIEQLAPEVVPEPGADSTPGGLFDDRQESLQRLGMLEGTIVQAEDNALIRLAEEQVAGQQRPGRLASGGIDIAAYAAGIIPGVGEVVGAIDTAADVSGFNPGQALFPTNDTRIDDAQAATRETSADAVANFSVLNALAHDASPPPVDPTGNLTEQEQHLYDEWLLQNGWNANDFAHMTGGFFRATNEFSDRT